MKRGDGGGGSEPWWWGTIISCWSGCSVSKSSSGSGSGCAMSGAQQPRLLNLLLQRGDPHSPWGFTTASDLHGNVTVKQVLPGTVGAHYLSPGDAILQVEGQDASHMPQWQVDACVHLPGKSLELLVLKKPEHEDTTARAGAPSGGGTLPRAKPRSYTRLSHQVQMEAESERQSQSHVNGSWTQSLTRSRRQLSWEGATHLRETNPLRRQSSQISGGGSPSPGPASPAGDGVTVCPPPPPPAFPSGAAPPAPPPPPPPNFGSIPSVRLNTEIADNRNQRGSTYEPPAAIQNAMMTKDKKPFTYTPGGLDLSQIRSPRMQRRISRNANAEGVPEQPAAPKTSPLAVGQLPPSALAAMQPQLPVPVFPTAQPTQYSPPPPPPPPMQPQRQQRVVESPPAQSPPPQQPQHIQSKPTSPQQNEPGSIYVPPVQQQQQQQGRAQVGSLYIPPVQQQQQLQEQRQTSSPLSPPPLNKAPTPWMSQRPPQQQVPPWAARASEEPGTRIIPIQVEGREPPTQSNKSPPAAASNQPNTRIIPIQMEGAEPASAQSRQSQQQQQNIQQRQPLYVHNKYNPPTPTENYPAQSPGQLQQQQSWGPPGAPIQSRSFRVLQKITDTDNQNEGSQYVEYPNSSTQGVPVQQLRKLELNDDDRALMNKFKAQVDEDTFLHNESDPRYRGAAIPSRAFRMLQSMTDGGTSSDFSEVPQSGGPVARGPQLRPSNVQPATECPPQPYIPPSEQQVQEPRKYTGGCIPSRSFRMLQAMTAPENCASVPSSDGRETPVFVSQQGYDESAAGPWGQYDPNVPPVPPYWGWGYYPPPHNPPPPPNLEGQPQPSPYCWDPYSAMYAYMAEMNAAYGYPPYPPPPVYSPHHFAPPPRSFRYPHSGSDSDECSGYSSTDEMAYYGANFTRRFPPVTPMGKQPQADSPMSSTPTPSGKEPQGTPPDVDKQTDPSDSSVSENTTSAKDTTTDYSNSEQNGYSDEETSGSDTEVEDDQGNSSGGLQMIRSVSDINVYSNNGVVNSHSSDTNDEETEREEEEEEEEDSEEEEDEPEEVVVYSEEQSCLPHQLSVIYEESEQSDAESVRQVQAQKFKDGSDGDSSTATQENGEDESDVDYDAVDPASSTVTVRLPLKLKFSRSENDEEVTTLIVGDSQVKRTTCDQDYPNRRKDLERQNGGTDRESDVSVTVCLSPRPYSCNKMEQQLVNKGNSSFVNKSPTPVGLAHQMSASDLDAYETAESDSDVSVCLSIPFKTSRKNSPVPSAASDQPTRDKLKTNEEDEDIKLKGEESDSAFSHWEDDSSSTSVQTVKLAADENKPISKEDVTSSERKSCTNDEFQDRNGQKEEEECEDSTSEDESSSSSDSEDSSRSYISSKEVEGNKKEHENSAGNAKTNLQEDKESSEDSSEESDDSDYENNASINEDKSADDVKQAEDKVQPKINEKTSTAGSKIPAPCTETKSNQEKEGKGKETLRRNSSKSQEESEEDDSGVTSDLSRPISDADTESETNQSELQLLTKCQRAATHSRLFKLLQDECGKSDDEDEEDQSEQQDPPDSAATLKSRKNQLTLPLNQNNSSDPDSLSSSSGFASPASPTITDRLVKELVKSLLQKKKGKKFKKLPIAKLQAAALRILQEDMDPYDTVSSAGSEDSNGFYLSPVHAQQHSNGATENNAANSFVQQQQQHPQYGANYYDYCDYYDSWANAAAYYGADPSCYEYDIVPSRAFKLLQEHAQPNGFSSGIINGLWGKCPRIPSSKNLHRDYSTSTPTPEDPPQTVVTSAQAS